VGNRAVTAPAVTVEGLGAGDDAVDRGGVAADAVGLHNAVGLGAGADGGWVGFEGEGEDILHARVPFVDVVAEQVLVWQVAIGADCGVGMRGVVPVLILVVHDVAVVARCGSVFQVSRRAGDPRKDPQRGQQSCNPQDQ